MNYTRLRVLTSRLLDECIEPSDFRELQEHLKGSQEAREHFLLASRLHAELCNEADQVEHLRAFDLASTKFLECAEPVEQPAERNPRVGAYTLAAGLLLAVGAALLLSNPPIKQQASLPKEEVLAPPAVADPVMPALASLGQPSKNCHWFVEGSDEANPSQFWEDDLIRVTSGSLEVSYPNGNSVMLHSPAAFQLVSAQKARVMIGRLTATVSEQGKGFTVVTPQADVIDLGTEFGVAVHDFGATDVVVFKGEIDVDCHNSADDAKRLRMGEGVRLAANGTASRLVSITDQTFSNTAEDQHSRPPIIAAVSDNIERDTDLYNFYEIVHEGMREDAHAFVDRVAHEYNGITSRGMPKRLLKGDYVKMFNSDKYKETIQIYVDIAQPANLYVLLDNRRAPPKWLASEFTDTGEDIGLDNGPFQTNGPNWHNRGPSGVGPGESIDDELSIWVKQVATPGVVQLGSLIPDDPHGGNMYGIVATPLIVH